MSTLEPSIALSTLETAIRELMTYEYMSAYGSSWMEKVTSTAQREMWESRAKDEAAARVPKGVARVPNVGLAYANFYDLIRIAEAHWQPLSAALGKLKSVLPLLERFDNLRNTIGHSRPLLPFEEDLMSGIAGQIRNQVTIYMSKQDDAGEIYPRIESITDSFGRRVVSNVVEGEVAGSVQSYDITVHPDEVVTFVCIGVDPQGRELFWFGPSGASVQGPSGSPTTLSWVVQHEDVTETGSVQIYMKTAGTLYHRFGSFDHRAYFTFRVRPPLAE